MSRVEYMCPVHGRFEVDVPRGTSPTAWPRDVQDVSECTSACGGEHLHYETCGQISQWSPGPRRHGNDGIAVTLRSWANYRAPMQGVFPVTTKGGSLEVG